jgi:peptidoglycan/LPS O-acetylase OafA/YrhL
MCWLTQLFKIETDYSKRIFGLDILRVIGILLVIEAHGFNLVVQFFPKTFLLIPLLDKVNFSFILSGFLIGSSLIKLFNREDFSFSKVKTFWIRRWLRTIPAYYLVITVYILLRYTFTNVGFVFPWKHYFFLQNIYTPEPDPYYFYPEAWSLAVEEWFYFSIPALLLLFHFLVSKFLGKKTMLITIILAVIGVSTFLRYNRALHTPDLTIHDWNIWFRKIVLFRLDTLMIGMLAAFVKYYFKEFWEKEKNKLFAVSLFLLSVTLLLYPYFLHQSFWLKTFYITQVSIAVALLVPKLDSIKTGSGFWLKSITFISKISFCIYLLNRTPILKSIQYLLPGNNLAACAFQYGLYVLLLFVSATLMHKFIEKPILAFRDKVS